MSRTDIHRPAHVLYQDPSMRQHFLEVHHHETGPCDLQEFLDVWLRQVRWTRTRCWVQWYSQQRLCSCEMCSMRAARRRARRQDRHVTRRQLHEAAAQYAGDDLDEDLPVARRSEAW
jgi:hypothetical protein